MPAKGRKKTKKESLKAKKKSTRALGKASPLEGFLWGAWLDHVEHTGPTWVWVALLLSHALCLRITEVLCLRNRDFMWQSKKVHIGPLKRQQATEKPMLSLLFPMLKKLKTHGKSRRRTKLQGVRGRVTFFDKWCWPSGPADYLFPSGRCHSKTPHHNKDSVCKAICRIRRTFKPPRNVFVENEKIRSHSGRHRMINDLKSAEVSQDVAMKFARIGDVRTFQGYGCLTSQQTAEALERNGRFKKQLKAAYSRTASKSRKSKS